MILLKDGKAATREDITEVLELHKMDARLYDDWAVTSEGKPILLVYSYSAVCLPDEFSVGADNESN